MKDAGARLKALARRVKAEAEARMQPQSYLRAPQLRPDDVFLVSYPRSGNTWLRAIIAELLNRGSELRSLRDLNLLVPDIHRGIPAESRGTRPRVIKTHQPYPNRHEAYRPDLYRRVIYIARHPFDVLSSYYDYQVGVGTIRADEVPFDAFVHRNLNYTDAYGSWQQHVLSWITMRDRMDWLLIKYEDLRADPEAHVSTLAKYLGVQKTPLEITHVVERASRVRMIELETAGSLVKQDYAFVRRRDDQRETAHRLTESLKAQILERCAEGMQACGYSTDRPR